MRSTVFFPFARVAQNDAAALFVEIGDAKLFDRRSAGKFLRFFNFVFDWQSVAIPAESARNAKSLHRLIARNNVLDRPGQKVPVMRQPGCERRPVVKRENRSVFTFFN